MKRRKGSKFFRLRQKLKSKIDGVMKLKLNLDIILDGILVIMFSMPAPCAAKKLSHNSIYVIKWINRQNLRSINSIQVKPSTLK